MDNYALGNVGIAKVSVYLSRFSSYIRMLRVTTFISRFISILKCRVAKKLYLSSKIIVPSDLILTEQIVLSLDEK